MPPLFESIKTSNIKLSFIGMDFQLLNNGDRQLNEINDELSYFVKFWTELDGDSYRFS